MPKPLTDIYSDLRDRKLLPVVVLLVVAIVAVPIALASSSQEAAPAPVQGSAQAADAPEAQSAVLVDDPGLRDYRKRLDALKSRNPFRQQFQISGLGETEVEGTSASDSSLATGGTAVDVSGSASSGTSSAPVGSSPTGSEPEEPASTEPAPSPSPAPAKTKTVTRTFTYLVDVQFGLTGEVKPFEDLDNLASLPPKHPLVVFLGVSEDGRRALFLVSSDVTSASGDGSCASFGGSACGLLVLKEGESQRLKSGKTRRLALTDIHREYLD
jgi:hypothetical protein